MRRVYLRIAAQALVAGAVVNEVAKAIWIEPAKALVKKSALGADWHSALLATPQLVGMLVAYKLVSFAMLWGFDRFRWVRALVDKRFDVEGSYLESVYINDELEVVGINHVAFVGGELTVDSELRWPRRNDNGSISLKIVARTVSAPELCTATSAELRYVFQDKYVEQAKLNKQGYTVLSLHHARYPSFWTRLVGKASIDEYTGSFDSFENDIHGRIHGRRLTGKELSDADGTDDAAREHVLVEEVLNVLSRGVKLRQEPPGVFVEAPPSTDPQRA